MDLVAPIVPNAQENKGAELFMGSLGQGLQAFARFSQMKRESEMDLLKLAEHERVSQEQNVLEREKMAIDADIRRTALGSTIELQRAHADYYKAGAAAYTSGTKTAAQRAIAFNQQRQSLVGEVNQHADELRLNDPVFQTKEPVKFAANVMQFETAWEQSTLPEVRHAIKTFRTVADQQKVPLRLGATFDEEKGAWVGGETKHVPVWQVVKNMQDPLQQEETMAALEASGHMKIVEGFQDIAGGKVPTKTTEPRPLIKSALQEGKDVKFERAPSRVPAAMLPKSAAGGTEPTELPAPDLPPEELPVTEPTARVEPKFEETQTDKVIRQAKAALAKGAPRERVAARLQELGIEPSVLLEAAA